MSLNHAPGRGPSYSQHTSFIPQGHINLGYPHVLMDEPHELPQMATLDNQMLTTTATTTMLCGNKASSCGKK